MSEEVQVIVEEPIEVVETKEEDVFSTEGLVGGELELAKKHGYIKEEEDGEHKSDPVVDKEDSSDEKEEDEVEEEVNTDPDNFEEMDTVMEKDEKKFHTSYSPNQKALYFKAKSSKKKLQDFRAKYEELETRFKEVGKTSGSAKKLDAINKLLTEDTDNLTIEALQKIISDEVAEEKVVDEPIKPDVVAAQVKSKADYAEKIGNAQHKNFEGISNLAKEIVLGDKSGVYQKIIDDAFLNDDIDETQLVAQVVNIARLHPKFDEVSGSEKTEKVDPKVNRVLKNSKKKASSASLSSSGGRRAIGESQLTCDQIARLPLSEYEKLSDATRKRAKMGIEP